MKWLSVCDLIPYASHHHKERFNLYFSSIDNDLLRITSYLVKELAKEHNLTLK